MTPPDVLAPPDDGQDPQIGFVVESADETGRTVTARLDVIQPGRSVRLYWDDQNAEVDLSAVGELATHTYSGEGRHLLQAHYLDRSGPGAAWVVGVLPRGRAGAAISLLLVRLDKLDPQAIWAVWVNPAGPNYTLRWGDGQSTDQGSHQPPVRHAYSAPGTYTVTAELPDGSGVSTQISVGTGPATDVSAPVVALKQWRFARQGWARLLISPQSAQDGLDHRSHAHHIDWGDQVREAVPAGTGQVVHAYGGVPEATPMVTVTDMDTGKQTILPAECVTAVTADNTPISEGFWKNYVQPVGGASGARAYLNDRLLQDGGWNGDIRDPALGANALTLVVGERVVVEEPFFVHAGEKPGLEGEGLYDFDLDHPNLLTVKPFTPKLWWDKATIELDTEWGDGVAAERLVLPPEHTAWQYGLHTSHWYPRAGRYTLVTTYRQTNYAAVVTRVALGPTFARLTGTGLTRVISLTLPDPRTPIRVDWGDGTPLLLTYPASHGDSTLTHTYARAGSYRITVHAPLQKPLVFGPVSAQGKTKADGHKVGSSTVRGEVSWSGRLEFETSDGVIPEPVRGLLPRGQCGGER